MKCINKLLSTSSNEEEKAIAVGVLGNLPLNNKKITGWLLEASTLCIIVSILSSGSLQITGDFVKNELVENTAEALRRFTIPTNPDLHLKAARAGVISILVSVLDLGLL